jgi:hypothetical protein
MRTVRRYTAAIAVMLAMLVTTSAKAQVMTLVPSEALVVIKIKNIKDVSDKVAALSQQWGLANIRPELNDPLGTILTAANLGPGLDKAGEAAVAVMDPGQGQQEPDVLILVPVSDFKAFAAALPNAKAEGALTQFSMGGNPEPGFAADWGKYAAISPKKELLSKKGGGMQVAGAAGKEIGSKDVIAYANLKVIRKSLLPLLQQNKGQMLKGIEQQMANAPGANPKYAGVMRAYLGQFVNAAEEFLTDADGATFGLSLSKEGISTTLLAEFEPNSYLGKSFGAMRNSDASFTTGLPQGKYFFFGGMAVDPAGIKLFNDFVAPIEKELAALGNEGKAIQQYVSAMKDSLTATKSMNFGMVAPAANMIGQEGIIQVVNVVTGDAAKLADAQKRMLAVQDQFMQATGAGANVKSTATPGAKTVQGVKLDQYTTSFAGQPQTPQEQQMQFVLQMLYGPKGINAFSGQVGADKSIMVAGGNDQLLESAVTAAKGGADALGTGTAAQVSKALPQNRLASFYLPIDTIATTVMDVMAQRGMPAGVKLPPNLPPLGASVATEGTALRVDGYIPAQTVQSLIAAGMQVWLQGMQGGGNQPGGL